jgi:hypothetical protein
MTGPRRANPLPRSCRSLVLQMSRIGNRRSTSDRRRRCS